MAVRAADSVLPEWRVFVRSRDGLSRQFIIGHRTQMAGLVVVAATVAWAATASLLLARQPAEIAAKEQRLDEQVASYQAAEQRLYATHDAITEVTQQVGAVQTNLRVLAAARGALDSDPLAAPAVQPAPAAVAATDGDQPGAARSVTEDVRRLEASLDQLHQAYQQMVHVTAEIAGQRVADTKAKLRTLGLDAERLASPADQGNRKGQGGPFIPLPADAKGDAGLDDMIGRLDEWNTVKVAMQKVPLAEPLHTDWEVNSPFGARHDPINALTGVHEGVDLGAPYGTPIYATAGGVVTQAGPYDRYGLTVDIDHGHGIVTRYAHLSRVLVKVGQTVSRSTEVGELGDTGRTTGAHLHYEVRVNDVPRDPLRFISAGGSDASEAR